MRSSNYARISQRRYRLEAIDKPKVVQRLGARWVAFMIGTELDSQFPCGGPGAPSMRISVAFDPEGVVAAWGSADVVRALLVFAGHWDPNWDPSVARPLYPGADLQRQRCRSAFRG